MKWTLLVIMALTVLFYMYIIYFKKNKSNFKKPTLVVFHLNNVYVRDKLRKHGFSVYNNQNHLDPYLFTYGGCLIYSFTEEEDHIIANAKKDKENIIDCGNNLKKFIYEIQLLKFS